MYNAESRRLWDSMDRAVNGDGPSDAQKLMWLLMENEGRRMRLSGGGHSITGEVSVIVRDHMPCVYIGDDWITGEIVYFDTFEVMEDNGRYANVHS